MLGGAFRSLQFGVRRKLHDLRCAAHSQKCQLLPVRLLALFVCGECSTTCWQYWRNRAKLFANRGGGEVRCSVLSTNYSWDSLYQEALAGIDLAAKLDRIRVAEEAISQRRRELVSRGDFCSEVYAAEEALMRR